MNRREIPQPQAAFRFSEQEQLFKRVSAARFEELVFATETTIHGIELSTNCYGEFVFVTVSRSPESVASFFGSGYHWYRERWIADEWFYYETTLRWSGLEGRELTHEEARELLAQRREELAPYLERQRQSERGRLYETLADLADEDFAWAEREDFEWRWYFVPHCDTICRHEAIKN